MNIFQQSYYRDLYSQGLTIRDVLLAFARSWLVIWLDGLIWSFFGASVLASISPLGGWLLLNALDFIIILSVVVSLASAFVSVLYWKSNREVYLYG